MWKHPFWAPEVDYYALFLYYKKETDCIELICKIVPVNSTKKHFIIAPPKHGLLSLWRTPAVIHTWQLIIDYKKQCPLSSKHQIFRGLRIEQSVQWLQKCDVKRLFCSLFEISSCYSIYYTPYLKRKNQTGLRVVHRLQSFTLMETV